MRTEPRTLVPGVTQWTVTFWLLRAPRPTIAADSDGVARILSVLPTCTVAVTPAALAAPGAATSPAAIAATSNGPVSSRRVVCSMVNVPSVVGVFTKVAVSRCGTRARTGAARLPRAGRYEDDVWDGRDMIRAAVRRRTRLRTGGSGHMLSAHDGHQRRTTPMTALASAPGLRPARPAGVVVPVLRPLFVAVLAAAGVAAVLPRLRRHLAGPVGGHRRAARRRRRPRPGRGDHEPGAERHHAGQPRAGLPGRRRDRDGAPADRPRGRRRPCW